MKTIIFLLLLINSLYAKFDIIKILDPYYNEVKNEIILEQKKLLSLLNNKDIDYNHKIIKKYGFNKIPLTKENILKRVQPIPKEIMYSQAFLESNDGKSRFAIEGFNFFGIWTYDPKKEGFIPKNRNKGATHRVQKFSNIKEAMHRYSEILNSSLFYEKFRQLRFKNNNVLKLAEGLQNYSEDTNYIFKIQTIIKQMEK